MVSAITMVADAVVLNAKQQQWIFRYFSNISLGLQMAVYEQAQRQATTDDLMKELQKQDREYFEKIIENQNRILSILSRFDDMSA